MITAKECERLQIGFKFRVLHEFEAWKVRVLCQSSKGARDERSKGGKEQGMKGAKGERS
jgi:hypothetical protein